MPASPLLKRLKNIKFAEMFESIQWQKRNRVARSPKLNYVAAAYFYSDGATLERWGGVHELRICDALALVVGLDPDRLGFVSSTKVPSAYFWKLFYQVGGTDPHSKDPVEASAHPVLKFVSLLNRLLPYVGRGYFGRDQFPVPIAEWLVDADAFSEFMRRNPIEPFVNSESDFAKLRLRNPVWGAAYETQRMRNLMLVHAYCFTTIQEGGTYDPNNRSTWRKPKEVAIEIFGISGEEALKIAYILGSGDPGRPTNAPFSDGLGQLPVTHYGNTPIN